MGWRQEHKKFQLEVGYANLAIGIWGLVAAAFNWVLVCGVVLAIYVTYLFCTLILHLSESHAWEELHKIAHRSRAIRNVVSSGFFVVVLAGFAFIAFAHAGVLTFIHL